jgi:hypothetical protein
MPGYQRDQRRDHHAQPRAQQARNLEAQALAAACGQDGERITAGEHLAHHLGLEPAEIVMTEGAAQHLARRG